MRVVAAMILTSLCLASLAARAQSIEWDTGTQHFIGGGGYGRINRLANGTLMLVEDFGGQTYVQRSSDNGANWGTRSLVGQNPTALPPMARSSSFKTAQSWCSGTTVPPTAFT